MNQKVLKTLEYHKIIEKLTEYAASEPGKRLCRELEPASDFEEIVQAQDHFGQLSRRDAGGLKNDVAVASAYAAFVYGARHLIKVASSLG